MLRVHPIVVRYNGFYNLPQEVPVTIREDGEIVHCNHAGYDDGYEMAGLPNPETGDIDEHKILVARCRACGATKLDGGYWNVDY